jgi:hypothetical protein
VERRGGVPVLSSLLAVRTDTRLMVIIRMGFGALVLLKAVDLSERIPKAGVSGVVPLIIIWVLAGAAIVIEERWTPYAAGLIAIETAYLFSQGSDLRNQHMYLFVWLGIVVAIGALARLGEVRISQSALLFAIRVQLSILYAFAALTKVTEDYLSGSVLHTSVTGRPVGQLLGFDTIDAAWPFVVVSVIAALVEGSLAIGLWTRFRLAFIAVGATFHISMVILMTAGGVSGARLAVFSGLVLLMYVAFLPVQVDAEERVVAPSTSGSSA